MLKNKKIISNEIILWKVFAIIAEAFEKKLSINYDAIPHENGRNLNKL